MMDVTLLAKDITAFLVPFLPYLLKAGEKAAEEAGKKAGGDAWEYAKAMWSKLHPGVEARPAALEAAQDAAADQRDEDAQAALRLQLKKLLQEDAALREEISRMLQEAHSAGINVQALGNRSVAIGGDVKSSVIVTGDQNEVNFSSDDRS